MPDLLLGIIVGAGITFVVGLVFGGISAWAISRTAQGKSLLPRKPKITVIPPPSNEKREKTQVERSARKQRAQHLKALEGLSSRQDPSRTHKGIQPPEKLKAEVRGGSPYNGPVATRSK